VTDVERALKAHPEWSNPRIATSCAVSHSHVRDVRQRMERECRLRSPTRRQTADGRVRVVAVTPVDVTYEGGLAARMRAIWDQA
jgi:hypothetical protein